MLETAQDFRPAPPPGLNSRRWAQDANEVKTIGGLISAVRTPEQTAIGHFWSETDPLNWNTMVDGFAAARGLSLIQSARIHALVSMAMADAYLAAWDAQYAYSLGLQNAAQSDSRNGSGRAMNQDAKWLPLADAPMRFEYPCARCVASAAVATILESALEAGRAPAIMLARTAAPPLTRRWTRVRDYADEVSVGQIYSGRSYRTATEVGQEMGREIGQYALLHYFREASR
jgi:hypothetical protein